MKLIEFMKKLEIISKSVINPDEIKIEMADCIPVIKPILKDKTVYITDIDLDISED